MEKGKMNQEKFYKKAHKALAELHCTGLRLKKIELKYSGPESEFKEIDKDKLRQLNKNLISKLGKDCFYWEVFDPRYDKENKPIQGWLVDDFSNIYSDLKRGLHKIDQIGTDESIEDALWELKFRFNYHWGNHCINAMRALHYLRYDGKGSI